MLDHRKELLNKIGFLKINKQKTWLESYNDAKEFYLKHNNLRVPYYEQKRLAVWLVKQRQDRYLGKLSEEQIALLNEIEFRWEKLFIKKESKNELQKRKELLESLFELMLNNYDQYQVLNSNNLKEINDSFLYLLSR